MNLNYIFLVKSSLNATHVYPMILGMKSILIFVNFMWIIAFSAHQKVETIVKSKLTESYNMFTKDNSTTYGKFLCRSIVKAGWGFPFTAILGGNTGIIPIKRWSMRYKSNLIAKLKAIFKKLRIKEESALKIGSEVPIKVLSELHVMFTCSSLSASFSVLFL